MDIYTTPIIPMNKNVSTLTRRELGQILAAEHIFKSDPAFWTWLMAGDIEWSRSDHNQKITIRSISERDFSLNGTCYPNEFELTYVMSHCKGQLNWTYTNHTHTQKESA